MIIHRLHLTILLVRGLQSNRTNRRYLSIRLFWKICSHKYEDWEVLLASWRCRKTDDVVLVQTQRPENQGSQEWKSLKITVEYPRAHEPGGINTGLNRKAWKPEVPVSEGKRNWEFSSSREWICPSCFILFHLASPWVGWCSPASLTGGLLYSDCWFSCRSHLQTPLHSCPEK